MKKLEPWPEGRLASLKLREDLYTIAQLCRPTYLRCFKIAKRDADWRDLDLNEVGVLFCMPVLRPVLSALEEGQVDGSVKPSTAPFERDWLTPNLWLRGAYMFRGARLVEAREGQYSTSWPVVKRTLSIVDDIDVIRRCEFTNPKDIAGLRGRLEHYFDTGRDVDAFKEKVFDVGPEILYPGAPDSVTILEASAGRAAKSAKPTATKASKEAAGNPGLVLDVELPTRDFPGASPALRHELEDDLGKALGSFGTVTGGGMSASRMDVSLRIHRASDLAKVLTKVRGVLERAGAPEGTTIRSSDQRAWPLSEKTRSARKSKKR